MTIQLAGRGHHLVEPVAGCDPAGSMLMAETQIDEFFVPQNHERPIRHAFEFYRDQGRRHPSEGTLPGPGVDETPRRRHFEKFAADPDPIIAPAAAHFDAICAAGTQIDLDLPGSPARRAPPFPQCRRLGPSAKNSIGRGPEAAPQLDRYFAPSCSDCPAFDGGSHARSSLSRYSPS